MEFLNKSIIISRLVGFVPTVSSWCTTAAQKNNADPDPLDPMDPDPHGSCSFNSLHGARSCSAPITSVLLHHYLNDALLLWAEHFSPLAGLSSQLWSAKYPGRAAHGLGAKWRFGPGSHHCSWQLFSIFVAPCTSQFSSRSFTSVTHIPAWGRNY